MMDYAIVVTKLADEDGGGFMAFVPDLYGCMSDGETEEQAVANVKDAAGDWLEVAAARGRRIPRPGEAVQRAKARESALISTIKSLTDALDGMDGLVEQLEKEIETIRNLYEDTVAWSVPVQLSSIDPGKRSSGKLLC